MKRKAWDITVKDNPNRVVMGENDEFYTTDTEAYLVFKLDDENFNPATAVLTLENSNDGSLKNETVDVVDGLIEWEMPQRYIEHFGNWQGQLVYEDTKDGQPELYTSAPFTFVVNAHIGDKKQPSLVEIENWEKFIREGAELIETWEDLEDLRQANEAQRQANYQELLDTGVLQTNINTKLEALEEEYAPRLTEVTAQLAQKAKQIDLEVERTRIDEFNRLAEGSTTGDAELIDGRIGADGKTYSNLGSAIREQNKNLSEDISYTKGLFHNHYLFKSDLVKDENWENQVSNSYPHIRNGEISINNNASAIFHLNNKVNLIAGNLYYLSIEVMHDAGDFTNINLRIYSERSFRGGTNHLIPSDPKNTWKKLVGVNGNYYVADGTETHVMFSSSGPFVGEVSAKNINLIDVTSIYGAGNEPTLLEFSKTLQDVETRGAQRFLDDKINAISEGRESSIFKNVLSGSAFENESDLSHWESQNDTTMQIVEGEGVRLSRTSSGQLRLSQSIKMKKGHKYLIGSRFKQEGTSSNTINLRIYATATFKEGTARTSAIGDWDEVTNISGELYKADGTETKVEYYTQTSDEVVYYIKDALLLDVTEIYGEGNEPPIQEVQKDLTDIYGKAWVGNEEGLEEFHDYVFKKVRGGQGVDISSTTPIESANDLWINPEPRHTYIGQKQFNITIDDVILCFRDLTNNADVYESIFENTFLKKCKLLYDKYGVRQNLVVFYSIFEENWDLSMATTKFKEEFEANKHWMRFGFHSWDKKVRYVDYSRTQPSSYITDRSLFDDYTTTRNVMLNVVGEAWSDYHTCFHFYDSREEDVRNLRETYGLRIVDGIAHQMGNGMYTGHLTTKEVGRMLDEGAYYDPKTDVYFKTKDASVERVIGSLSSDYPTMTMPEFLDWYKPNDKGYIQFESHEYLFNGANMIKAFNEAFQWCVDNGYTGQFPAVSDLHNYGKARMYVKGPEGYIAIE